MKRYQYCSAYFFLILFFFFSFNSGLHAQIWELANKTHRSTQIIPVNGKVVFSISNHLFFSSDLGNTFTVDNGSVSDSVSGFAVGSLGNFYFSSPAGLYSSPAYSDMNNENWVRIDSTNVPEITALYVRPAAGIAAADEIFIGTASGLFSRSSLSNSWKKIHDAGDGAPILQIAASNKNIYYRTQLTAFASHDGGATWAGIATSVTNGDKTGLVVTSDTDVYIAINGFPGSHILHSNDGGTSFNGFRGIDFSSRTIQTLAANTIGDLYLGGGIRDDINADSITQGFVFHFPHDGFAWEDYSGGLPPAGPPSSEVIGLGFGANGNVFAGTDSAGLWRTFLPSSVKPSVSQNGILLSQNYPNPANSATEFTIFTDHSIKGVIVVIDAMGRTVVQLSDGEITSGNHFFRIDTKSLPNGTYFYRLQTPETIQNRSFVVSK